MSNSVGSWTNLCEVENTTATVVHARILATSVPSGSHAKRFHLYPEQQHICHVTLLLDAYTSTVAILGLIEKLLRQRTLG